MSLSLNPQIYVADATNQQGAWIDAAQSPDELFQSIQTAHQNEWLIASYTDFGQTAIETNESLETISKIAIFIKQQGEFGSALLAFTRNNVEEAQRLLDECYIGAFKNEQAFARSLCEEVPEFVKNYIDYESLSRDLFSMDGYFSIQTESDLIHVFRD